MPGATKRLEESIGNTILDFDLGNYFFSMTPKAQAIKAETEINGLTSN